MLVLSRKSWQWIKINTGDTVIRIKVTKISPGLVKLGFEAEPHVSIIREELEHRAPTEQTIGE